jgi:hypothetical protein
MNTAREGDRTGWPQVPSLGRGATTALDMDRFLSGPTLHLEYAE